MMNRHVLSLSFATIIGTLIGSSTVLAQFAYPRTEAGATVVEDQKAGAPPFDQSWPSDPFPSSQSPSPRQPATPSAPSAGQSSGQMSEAEARMRIMLMQQAIKNGPGGLFAPTIRSMLNGPGADPCAHYTDPSARGACKNKDFWAADRLQRDRSPSAERDWYNR